MARYQFILAYDGTQFEGFQRQAKARTVQGEIEKALRKLNWQGSAVLSAGRTDSGTHALGQVIAFDLDWTHSTEELCRAINSHLPQDIAVSKAWVVSPGFHPRYDAIARCYRYHLFVASGRNPLKERYAWRVETEVDISLLETAAGILTGVHDFTAFGTPPRPGGSTLREVKSAEWIVQTDGLRFEILANAFLYHMIRRLVYLQVLVGQRRLGLDQFNRGVFSQEEQPPGLAPANGLVLAYVVYPSESKDELDRSQNTAG